TTSGKIAGRQKGGVLLFAGVPFAAPPIGDRRFKAPEPHEGWSDVRDATLFGRVAVQVGDSLGALGAAPAPDWSEDCLFLNVQTPALDDARRPVMVWIHGGAFVNGTGAMPWYDGANFVRHGDVVVVSINYRLGALGWLELGHLDPDYDTSGNNGLLDQIAALRWVHDNIDGFGGDPDNVTIFGESAGAMSVGTLLGTPAATGLFAKAIAQSGAAHNVSSMESATVVTGAFLKELGGGGLEAVATAEPARLLEAQQAVSQAMVSGHIQRPVTSASGLPFGPVIDGAVLPRHPAEAIRDGLADSIPLLTGTTRDEWNLFGLMDRRVEDVDTLIRRLRRFVDKPEPVAAAYRGARAQDDDDALFKGIMTDRMFRVPAIRMAESQAAHQPENTFMYLFEYASTAFDGRLGSCHALEIPFVFDNLHKAGAELLTGPEPPQSVADAMHAAWIAFVRTGSPVNDARPEWPAYDTRRRTTMYFGVPCHLESDPDSAERLAWSGLL
ncbi:MAG TPA: carboxylesterase/lipase family protein, partial [Acidimicrobiales bacterium]|nr:carboxylesterase/lipase family protein [Acidimicrobiales bacterium]